MFFQSKYGDTPLLRRSSLLMNVPIICMEDCSWEGAVKECLLNEEAYQLAFERINNTFDAWRNQLRKNSNETK